jgi:superfamily I DNA/RNA helicase
MNQLATAIIPTEEQQAIIDAASRGESFRILAFAGTGKTTTLRFVATALKRRRILYLVFNNSQARQAEKRFAGLPHVTPITAHALALRHVGNRFGDRIAKGEDAAKLVWRRFLREKALHGRRAEEQTRLLNGIFQTLARFVASADSRINVNMVTSAGDTDREEIATLTESFWQSLANDLPVTHDVYLKFYQLGHPNLGAYDAVLYDEAQDATPAMVDVVERQRCLQKLYCGDSHQQLYAFRGAVDTLAQIGLPALPLTHTRRFGPEIARVANAVLAAKGEPRCIVGMLDVPGIVRRGKAAKNLILARTNVGLVERAFELANGDNRLFIRGAPDRKTGDVGSGAADLRSRIGAAFDLWQGKETWYPAFKGFTTWEELRSLSEDEDASGHGPIVRIVEKYQRDVPHLLARLRDYTCETEAEATVVLSTVHRFKGEESRCVELASDFRLFLREDKSADGADPRLDVEEANIAYVAVTRAKSELYYGGAYDVFRRSLAEMGIDVPVSQPPEASAWPAVHAPREPQAAAVALARSFKDLAPGTKRYHAHYGVVEVLDATAQLIRVRLSSGDVKDLATLGTYPQLQPVD